MKSHKFFGTPKSCESARSEWTEWKTKKWNCRLAFSFHDHKSSARKSEGGRRQIIISGALLFISILQSSRFLAWPSYLHIAPINNEKCLAIHRSRPNACGENWKQDFLSIFKTLFGITEQQSLLRNHIEHRQPVNCVDIFHLHFVLSQLNRERNLLSILEEAASEMRSLRVQGGRFPLSSFSCLRSEWIALAKPRHKHYWSRSWTVSLAKMSHTIFISPEQQLEASVYDWFPIQRSHYQRLLKTNKQVFKI